MSSVIVEGDDQDRLLLLGVGSVETAAIRTRTTGRRSAATMFVTETIDKKNCDVKVGVFGNDGQRPFLYYRYDILLIAH